MFSSRAKGLICHVKPKAFTNSPDSNFTYIINGEHTFLVTTVKFSHVLSYE
jgi:hypothetical protein